MKDRIWKFLEVPAAERPALLWSFLYFFSLLCAYYALRPVRDEMGIQGGVDNLQWLFTATFAAMLVMVPLFGWVIGRFSRRVALPLVYSFFILNLLLFYLLFSADVAKVHVARVFFVWLSVFNLFVVSVFWSFMVDLFDADQAKRLFGIIAAGGSAGAVAGPALTAALAVPLGIENLMLVSAAFLTVAISCIYRLRRWSRSRPGDAGATAGARLGGSPLEGAAHVLRSPYLLGVCAYVLLYTTLATFLYFTQAQIVRDAFSDPDERTRVFALLDLATNSLTVFLQLFVTARVATRMGISFLLAVVPGLLVLGFALLGVYPVIWVLITVQVLRRAGNYALARPGREMLFSVLARVDKYKSKNFIDTVVYRGGDALSGWVYTGLKALGLGVGGIAFIAAPLAGLWLWCGWRLGAHRESLSKTMDKTAAGGKVEEARSL